MVLHVLPLEVHSVTLAGLFVLCFQTQNSYAIHCWVSFALLLEIRHASIVFQVLGLNVAMRLVLAEYFPPSLTFVIPPVRLSVFGRLAIPWSRLHRAPTTDPNLLLHFPSFPELRLATFH